MPHHSSSSIDSNLSELSVANAPFTANVENMIEDETILLGDLVCRAYKVCSALENSHPNQNKPDWITKLAGGNFKGLSSILRSMVDCAPNDAAKRYAAAAVNACWGVAGEDRFNEEGSIKLSTELAETWLVYFLLICEWPRNCIPLL